MSFNHPELKNKKILILTTDPNYADFQNTALFLSWHSLALWISAAGNNDLNDILTQNKIEVVIYRKNYSNSNSAFKAFNDIGKNTSILFEFHDFVISRVKGS